MSKPMPRGCIKKELTPTWRKFNLLLQKKVLDDEIRHLFIVDISFDFKNATIEKFYIMKYFLLLLKSNTF